MRAAGLRVLNEEALRAMSGDEIVTECSDQFAKLHNAEVSNAEFDTHMAYLEKLCDHPNVTSGDSLLDLQKSLHDIVDRLIDRSDSEGMLSIEVHPEHGAVCVFITYGDPAETEAKLQVCLEKARDSGVFETTPTDPKLVN